MLALADDITESIEKISLKDVLDSFVTKGAAFSFVSATEINSNKIFQELKQFYGVKHELGFVLDNKRHLFDNLSVVDNIYIERVNTRGAARREQVQDCELLLSAFGLTFDAFTIVRELTEEQKIIVELLRIYELNNNLLIVNNSTSGLGYLYFNTFIQIISALRKRDIKVIFLTTRWEDSINFSRFLAVNTINGLYTVFPKEMIVSNPRRILYALAGEQLSEPNPFNPKRISTLSAIYHVSELIEEKRELSGVIMQFAEVIKNDMSAQSCIIYLKNKEGDIYHYPAEMDRQNSFLLNENFVSQCIRGNDEIYLFSEHNCKLNELFISSGPQAKLVMCLPIIVIPDRMGILALTFDQYFLYSEEELNYLRINIHEIGQALQAAELKNNTILFQEINHRIKNNLQIITSLVDMQKYTAKQYQKEFIPKDQVLSMLEYIVSQIKSVSNVQELLTNDTAHGDKVDVHYLIVKNAELYQNRDIKITVDTDAVYISGKLAISLTIVVNELICNCYRHAFKNKETEEKRIWVSLKKQKDTLVLKVWDNGIGMGDPNVFLESNGVGTTIVQSTVKGMNGSLDIISEEGTCFIVRIPFDRNPKSKREV